jgi:hypothetical protein
MLDQMQVTTPVDAHSSSLASPYVIGPIDPAQITTLPTHLSTGEECSLSVPVQLPPAILTHPVFKEGYECSYTESDPEEMWTVPKLVNEIYHLLTDLCYEDDPDVCPWTLGFLLGDLASLAERDRTLAFTGLAHCCFLLSFISLDPPSWPFDGLIRAHWQHNDALRTYRAQVRVYREQGKSFAEAQRLALVGSTQ